MDRRPIFSDLRVVLLGKAGAGKSASGKTIIGGDRDLFEEAFLPNTPICQSSEVDGQKVYVIDTIGLSDTPKTDIETQNNRIEQIFDCACDGVDVFLLVIKLGDKYTEEEQKTMKWTWIQKIFGAKALKHTIVLFTHGDLLNEPVEECLSKSEILRSVVDQCAGRYHVFNNKSEDPSQVTDLLRKIETLRKMNRYNLYTKQDYEESQRELQEEMCRNKEAAEERERLLKESEEKERLLEKATERQERLLKEAAEEKERLLREAAEERERLLREAAEERERLLKEAAEERKRLLREAEEKTKILEKATKRQERLLREAAEEKKRLLKEAAEENGKDH